MGSTSHRQLVMEYLERYPGDILTTFPGVIREFIRGKHGIYALYRKSELYYVGLATDLSRRLKQHLNDRHSGKWDRFSIYITREQQHMRDLESLVLRISTPSGNRDSGEIPGAKRLNRTFTREILAKMAERLDGKERRPATQRRKKPEASPSSDRPVLSAYVTQRFEIRMTYKGRTLKAKVRANGMINCGGKLFRSPSLAAANVRKKKTANGWKLWKYKNAAGEWVYLDELRKDSSSTRRTRTKPTFDAIVCPAAKDGFQDTFLGKRCWYAIRLNAKRIPDIQFCAIYRNRPVSAITHWARVESIKPYRNTGKYIVRLAEKPHTFSRPVPLRAGNRGRSVGPQGPFFTTLNKLRKASTLADL